MRFQRSHSNCSGAATEGSEGEEAEGQQQQEGGGLWSGVAPQNYAELDARQRAVLSAPAALLVRGGWRRRGGWGGFEGGPRSRGARFGAGGEGTLGGIQQGIGGGK